MTEHKSIAKKPLQGGAPNNVLSLQKAERKKMMDYMFPFIVKNRLEDDSRTIEMSNLGPGSYSPQNNFEDHNGSKQYIRTNQNNSTSRKETFVDAESNKMINLNSGIKANCFGSSQQRFDENERLVNKQPSKMGPGAYTKLNYEPKGKNFSTRFIGNNQ